MREGALQGWPVAGDDRVERDRIRDRRRRRNVGADLSERRGRDPELRIEDVDKDQAEPEVGDRAGEEPVADRRARGDSLSFSERAQDSERDADQKRKEEDEEEEGEGRRQPR